MSKAISVFLVALLAVGCAVGAATPAPSMTADDQQIASIVTEMPQELARRLPAEGESMSDAEGERMLRDARDYVEDVKTRIDTLTPSPCTAEAVGSFKKSLDKMHQSLQEILDWRAAGSLGDAPGYEAAFAAGSLMDEATTSLAASC